MSETTKDSTVSSKKTPFDQAARCGIALSLFSFLVTLLILRSFTRDSSFIGVGIFFCSTQITSFIIGVVSLFGHRKHWSSFWLALLTVFVSGIFGFYILCLLIFGFGPVRFG